MSAKLGSRGIVVEAGRVNLWYGLQSRTVQIFVRENWTRKRRMLEELPQAGTIYTLRQIQ